jgi:hypothetical protein
MPAEAPVKFPTNFMILQNYAFSGLFKGGRSMMKVDYLCPKTYAETPNLDNINVNAII